MNNVQYLLETNFSALSLEEKCEIKKLGRPTPQLELKQAQTSRGKTFCRSFNENIYRRNGWICGCISTNKLFCFPCLLFAKGRETTWTCTGVSDLAHLTQKVKKHEESITHKNAYLDLSVLGKTEIRQQLSSAFRQNIERHNDNVRKNRYVLSKIIDCIKFCGEFEIALRGHDVTAESNNTGIFRGLINFTSALDALVKEHMNEATAFKGTSQDIQNDLLECMLNVCHEEISEEIAGADFVSVIADEASDISSKFQLLVVFRYILSMGEPVERFWAFLNPTGNDASAIAACIKNVLANVVQDRKEKVISQSYNGASVMCGQHAGVHTIVREEYNFAYYVHCYAHQLNLTLAQATSRNKQVKLFFSTIAEVSIFFSHSPQRVAVLDAVVKRRVPHGTTTIWNFTSRTVLTVHENKEDIIECLQHIEDTSNQETTVNQAYGLRLKLQQSKFSFWLEVFYKIMPHVDILYNQLQKRTTDPISIQKAIVSFEREILKIRNDFDIIVIKEEQTLAKRRCEEMYVTMNEAAKEVCDIIIQQSKQRFEFSSHLLASTLFDHHFFPSMKINFPEAILSNVVHFYPFLNNAKLKTELQIIYSRNDFQEMKSAITLLRFLIENNLQEPFGELMKLLKLVATIPMTTCETERCFSTLSRIKTFLKSTMDEDRLSAFAMLSIEKQMIHSLPDFNERVIDKFATKKERSMEFLYIHTSIGDTIL